MGDFRTILYEASNGVGRLTLNRPEQLNGITGTMIRELHELLNAIATDSSLAVVVLTGAGRGFCPGADLKHYSSGEAVEPSLSEYFDITRLLHELPAVTVAGVNGACAGAGMGWACACDLRFAARSAKFATAFLNVAVAGDMALPWSLPRLVGAAKARELSFLSGKFDADEALRLGLVSGVFDDDVFRVELDAVVDRLAGAAPLAIRGMKANYLAAERMGLGDFITIETERHQRISASADTQEAFKAFVEKRRPTFQGR